MKIDRYSPGTLPRRVKLAPIGLDCGSNDSHNHGRGAGSSHVSKRSPGQRIRLLWLGIGLVIPAFSACGKTETPPLAAASKPSVSQESESAKSAKTVKTVFPAQVSQQPSQPEAVRLLQQVLAQLVHGPAFDAKVRETVWTTGREVVGVGTYEQAGGGTGRFNLQLTMHDGDGKHRLQQISDGRLAWTRSEIADQVSLRRVDVGRLDELVRGVTSRMPISPRLKVGAWGEMLSTIERDYVLEVVGAHLQEEPVWVITGKLRQERRDAIMKASGRSDWPILSPSQVRVAVRSKADPETEFGALLPVRFEFWSDPVADLDEAEGTEGVAANREGRLITLIELYSIRPISPPPPERFRFENQDAEVNFTNETDRYVEQYGVRLTDRQRRQLRR